MELGSFRRNVSWPAPPGGWVCFAETSWRPPPGAWLCFAETSFGLRSLRSGFVSQSNRGQDNRGHHPMALKTRSPPAQRAGIRKPRAKPWVPGPIGVKALKGRDGAPTTRYLALSGLPHRVRPPPRAALADPPSPRGFGGPCSLCPGLSNLSPSGSKAVTAESLS